MSDATLTPSGDGRWVLGGTLDFSSVPQVWPSLARLFDNADPVTLSLADVSRANSAGLVLLVEARGLARQGKRTLKLVDVPAELLDLASMSRCEELISEDGV